MSFSFQGREKSLRTLGSDTFDLLIIGGGITGAAVARDAATRGLKVALIEKGDFSQGTSSHSSKLIHGGLRYLEKLEFHLVFEALSERAFLLKNAPHLVQPLPFYFPVYRGMRPGKFILGLGLWLYDLLSLFRTPGFHKRFSARALSSEIPSLNPKNLLGGFRYFDATMWDDVLVVDTMRSAFDSGAHVVNYVEAINPLWKEDQIQGFTARNVDPYGKGEEIEIRAHRTILCAGPWTDLLGSKLSVNWEPWLRPSTGIHLVFDYEKLPVPGAVVMHHDDGRIAFVIPRKDFGKGVVIVGTTDGPSPKQPEDAVVTLSDLDYLMKLLTKYFPSANLQRRDIVSVYLGIRPLYSDFGKAKASLKSVSREHHIDRGPGGVTLVAGGKYTTHRPMAREIVDFTLKQWERDTKRGKSVRIPFGLTSGSTKAPVHTRVGEKWMVEGMKEAEGRGWKIPRELFEHYGMDALELYESESLLGSSVGKGGSLEDPEGFPFLIARLRYALRKQMVMRLEDFYFRRTALFLARADHGASWIPVLTKVWAEERGLSSEQAKMEADALIQKIREREDALKALKECT